MDGFGHNKSDFGNAVAAAKKPNLDMLMEKYPYTYIGASGMDVGLPDGQMGNSEVGHTNMGAGRVVYQELTRITKAIDDGEFFENEALKNADQKSIDAGKHFTLWVLFPTAVFIATTSTSMHLLNLQREWVKIRFIFTALWTAEMFLQLQARIMLRKLSKK